MATQTIFSPQISDDVMAALERTGSVITGHFVLKSAERNGSNATLDGDGDHSDTYFDKDRVTKHPIEIDRLGLILAAQIFFAGLDVEVLVCPAIGAIKLTEAVARYLSILLRHEVLTVYAEEADGRKQLRRSDFAETVKGNRCFVIEDIATTASSFRGTIEAAKSAGGMVVGGAVFIERCESPLTAEALGLPYLFVMCRPPKPQKWDRSECPMCGRNGTGSVNTTLGKGRQFLQLVAAGR